MSTNASNTESMPTIDLSQFTEVTTANSAVKIQDFRLKVNYAKATFTFSQALFDEMSLATNSLKQYNRFRGPASEKGVYFTLCPGNDGVWMKKKASGEKGKTHKNERFVEALQELGITATKLNMIYVGDAAGYPLYKVVVDSPEQANPPSGEIGTSTEPDPIETGLAGADGDIGATGTLASAETTQTDSF